MVIYDVLDLRDPDVEVGNHSIWHKKLKIKVPFQLGGKTTKYSYHQDRYSIGKSFFDEIHVLNALAQMNMAPPIGELVYFRELIHDGYFGALHSDPLGAFGFQMGDVNDLPPGSFDINKMRELPIEGTERAWNDVLKPGNVQNGYLIDARRSEWDMFKWRGEKVYGMLEPFVESKEQLTAETHKLCQFPKGERDKAYQDFWVHHEMIGGQRRVLERAEKFEYFPLPNQTVLDIGTQCGSFLQFAWYAQACKMSAEDWKEDPNKDIGIPDEKDVGKLVGIDVEEDYLKCAKNNARSCNQHISFIKADVNNKEIFLKWLKTYFPKGVDHLLMFSMEKHLDPTAYWDIIDTINAGTTYIETNAVPEGQFKLRKEVEDRGGNYIGDSNDRNRRNLYKISRR